MLLDQYNEQGLLTVTSVLGATGENDTYAFRGDLVLKEGELREGSDRDRKTPELVIHQAVVLSDQEKILFAGGLMYEVEHLPVFVEKYKEALSADSLLVMFVENIAETLLVEYEGFKFQMVPYKEGMIWNEFLDLFYLEKSDLKGQSAEQKVVTVFDSAKDYKGAVDAIAYEAALEKTIVVEKDMAVGPV